uniref:Uncharacterized protein n=1 Tax=Molossus molossus TaxID=27622 RepID=A0A7J8J0L9_MOLMO|nr:hypothetical protein HJG59_010339 [Molossus molossus]
MHRDLFLVAPFFSSMTRGDPLYSPSSCCFGWAGGDRGRRRESLPSAGAAVTHGHSTAVFATLAPHALFTWLLPSNSLVLMQKNLEEEEPGLNVKIQGGKKWGTDCVLFQKRLKCMELHNTVYCSEAAS